MNIYLILSVIFFCLGNIEANQKFKHPYETEIIASEKHDNLLQSINQKNSKSDDAYGYYIRLVKHLFRKQRFKRDPRSDEVFITSIPLKLKKDQWELLVNSDITGLNLNEIDELVEEILMQSQDVEWESSVTTILFEYYREELINSFTSFSSPIILILTSLIVIVLCSKLFNFSKLTYSALIVFGLLFISVVSYVMMYHDCMNDLEVEQMIKLSKENSLNNPCKDYHGEHESYWSSFKATVLGSSENKCLEYMRTTFKPSKKYCDPLDVAAKWSAKIQMSYFGSIFESFLELLTKFTSSSNLLTKIVMWITSMIFLGYLIVTLVKVFFKHGFQMFGTILTKPMNVETNYNEPKAIEELNSKIDTLLNENEQMKRDLRVIRECSVERAIENVSAVKRSRLSEITEATDDINDTKDAPW